MSVLSLQEAADQAGASKVDVWRAIQDGQLPAKRTDGGFAIDAGDLFRVFERRPREPDPAPPDPPAAEEGRGPSPETSAPLEVSATPEKPAPSEINSAFAALAAELNGLLEPHAAAAKADLPSEADEPGDGRRGESEDRDEPPQGAEKPAETAEAISAAALSERRSWRRWLGGG